MVTYKAVPEYRPEHGKWAIQAFEDGLPLPEKLQSGFETEASAQAAIEKLAKIGD